MKIINPTRYKFVVQLSALLLLILAAIGFTSISSNLGLIDSDSLIASTYSLLGGEIVISPAQPAVGIIGDSNSDEYRGDDDRGGAYKKNTLNWAEQLAQSRLVNFGAWSDTSRGEPRRKGFAFNWARTASTTTTLLQQGQHTSLAQQLKNNNIGLVVIHIGANDFAPYFSNGYAPIYNNTLTDAQVTQKINTIIANIQTALNTVHVAGEGRIGVIVTNILDWNIHPAINSQFPDATKRARVTRAIDETNNKMQQLASQYGAAFNDLNDFGHDIISRLDSQGRLKIGGILIKALSMGDAPKNGFLGDQIHAGTVLEGLFANEYVSVFNQNFGQIAGFTLQPLSEKEILQNAGLVTQPDECLSKVKYSARLICLQNRN